MDPWKNKKNNQQIESALIADCGSNTTRVVLVEIVDKAYRFVARGEAPSTAEAPYLNVTIGIVNAIANIEYSTGRKLLTSGKLIIPQDEEGVGVDAFLASSSAAEPLRLVAAGLVRSLSAETAIRASHATYTTILDTISLDDYGDEEDTEHMGFNVWESEYDPNDPGAEFSPFLSGKSLPSIFQADTNPGTKATSSRSKNKKNQISLFARHTRRAWRERQVAKLRRLGPNLIVISGGVGDAPFDPIEELLDVVLEANRQEAVIAMATGEQRRSATLVFSGNEELQNAFLRRVAGQMECFLVDSLRQDYNQETLEPLQNQLSALYQERLLPGLPGYRELVGMSSAPINTTCRAVGLMTHFLAKDIAGNRVLTADLGGNNTSLFYATADKFSSMVRGDFGLSYGLSNVLAEAGVAGVKRWVPFEISDDEIVHYALNKTLRPRAIPADDRERFIEAAFAREAIRFMFGLLTSSNNESLDFNRVIGLGGPLINNNPWQTAMILLDALQPRGSVETGIIDLELDSTMLMSAAGTLATFNPNAAVYVFSYDCLHRLGPVIVPLGQATPGSIATKVTVRVRGGRTREISVPYGEIAVVPLHTDEEATLEIEPARGFRIGNAAPGVPVKTQQYVRGGSVGLIIDARGRPLRMPAEGLQRQEMLSRWHSAYRHALQQAENEGPDDFGAPVLEKRYNEKKTPTREVKAVQAPPPSLPVRVPPVESVTPTANTGGGLSSRTGVTAAQSQKPAIAPEDLLRQEMTGRNKKKKK